MKIVADMRSITSWCPGSEYSSSHCIATVAIMSSNYITVRALLETAKSCRTTSSIAFHQTFSFPSSVGKGSGYTGLDHSYVYVEGPSLLEFKVHVALVVVINHLLVSLGLGIA